MIVDFKISQPSDEKIPKYQTQLQAYHYAFLHPAHGEVRNITKMGLIIMYPDQVKFEGGEAHMTFPPKWMEIPMENDKFIGFITKVSGLLEGPTPPENPDCKWCKYRHLEKYLVIRKRVIYRFSKL